MVSFARYFHFPQNFLNNLAGKMEQMENAASVNNGSIKQHHEVLRSMIFKVGGRFQSL